MAVAIRHLLLGADNLVLLIVVRREETAAPCSTLSDGFGQPAAQDAGAVGARMDGDALRP
jgi:hypothetical protein